jgi:hypothetical protein
MKKIFESIKNRKALLLNYFLFILLFKCVISLDRKPEQSKDKMQCQGPSQLKNQQAPPTTKKKLELANTNITKLIS